MKFLLYSTNHPRQVGPYICATHEEAVAKASDILAKEDDITALEIAPIGEPAEILMWSDEASRVVQVDRLPVA